MRFAILTLAFYGSSTLERMIRNTGAFVDKIYISYSQVAWTEYNRSAESRFSTDFDRNAVMSSPYSEKIRLLEGIWENEHLQRQNALEVAKNEGIDYLIIQDADEFYLPEDFQANINGIRNNPNYPAYRCPWTVFWKSTQYVIEVREHNGMRKQTITSCPNFAVNLNWPGIKFMKNRLVSNIDKAFMLPGLCLHLAWVLSDTDVLRKVSTWGHSHQFNYEKFYRHKWLAWTPKSKFIGHISRANYLRAVPYDGAIPNELSGLGHCDQLYRRLTFGERIDSAILDMKSIVKVHLSCFKNKFVKIIRFFK